MLTNEMARSSRIDGPTNRTRQWHRMAAVASGLALIAGCGSSSSTATSPETFLEDLEVAVEDFAADLDDIDADYAGRSWDIPDDGDERYEFTTRTWLEIHDEYLDAWRDYVARLRQLQPPEGFPEAGEGFADGLPGYFDEAIVQNERAALAASELVQEAYRAAGDPYAIWHYFTGPKDEVDRIGEAVQVWIDAWAALADGWQGFENVAEAVDHPIDAFDLRLNPDMKLLDGRALQLAGSISGTSDES